MEPVIAGKDMKKHIGKMITMLLGAGMLTCYSASAASADISSDMSAPISLQDFVLMTAETLDVPIIKSDAEMSAMRYAYKAGWIETSAKSTTVTREQAADILVTASGNVVWPQDTVPFMDADDISEKYQDAVSCAANLGLVMGDPEGTYRPKDVLTHAEARYLMERLKNTDAGVGMHLLPDELKALRIEYLGNDAILESGMARRALTDIPQNLLAQFAEEGWTLYFTSDPLSTYYPEHFGGVGVTDYEKKAICVFVDASYMYSAEDTLLHEFGHFLQHTLNGRFDDEIQRAYEEGKEKLAEITGRNYCTTNEREFFAEAFRIYLQKRNMESNLSRVL